jgi:hypothetical protein
MKSPIKELGDYLCENDYLIDKNLILKIKELLKKEKEQTIDFAYGCTQHISRQDIETYYIKTFNNNKK